MKRYKVQRKQTIFENTSFTTNLDANPTNTTETTVQRNIREIHHSIVEHHLQSLKPNKIINQPAPPINKDEQTLLRKTRRTLAQLRTNKSPFLKSYLHKTTHPHYALYVTLKTMIPNKCSSAPHYQHTSHPLTYGMTLWPWRDCCHSGTMPCGLAGAVRDPGWRNGDRDGQNTHTLRTIRVASLSDSNKPTIHF